MFQQYGDRYVWLDFAVDSVVNVCTSGDLLKGELTKRIIDGKVAILVFRNACFGKIYW